MSICNLNRPPTDAVFQNVAVNNQLRVNKILKVTSAEVGRLCSLLNRSQHQQKLVGSYKNTAASPNPVIPVLPDGFSTYIFPSGATIENTNTGSNITVNNAFYTDAELSIDKFQITVTGSSTQTTPVTFQVSIGYGPNPSNVGAVDVATLSVSNVTSVPLHATYDSSPVIIPANSYVSVHIVLPNGASVQPTCEVGWSIFIA
jgi:hypothetical protein